MKIYIFADMEGISGVSAAGFVRDTDPYYAEGRDCMTADVNACAKACFDAGADQVIVRDGHGMGRNLRYSQLIPDIRLIQGGMTDQRFPALEGTDGVILLGYHVMAGTVNGLLDHTFDSSRIQNIFFNGEKIGEFGIDTLIAGEHGVPVIMTSGCDKFCAEAKAFLPDVVTCEVKKSLHCESAVMLSSSNAHELIRAQTMYAIRLLKEGKFQPKKVDHADFRIEFTERREPKYGLCDCRTVEASGESVEKTFFEVIYR